MTDTTPPTPASVTMQGILDKVKGATYTLLPNGRTTICQLTMANGFTVEGSSACVDIAKYNQALGEKYAYEDALNNVWKFEGYLLAESIANSSLPAAMAVVCAALRNDPEYAWGWHCNLTMMAYDAGAPHPVASEGSARFLQILADINVRHDPRFAETIATRAAAL